MNNLKQLSLALQGYATDNGGCMPQLSPYNNVGTPMKNWCGCLGVGGWVDPRVGSLWPYSRNEAIYICPTDMNRKARGLTASHLPANLDPKVYPLSYSINGELNKRISATNGYYELLKLDSACKTPARVLLFIHESRDTINDGLYLWRNNNCDTPDKVHYEGTTVSYCDGHVKWVSTTRLLQCQKASPSEWDPIPSR
jgi:prepilin-type processing-associated H-X9-DG protein